MSENLPSPPRIGIALSGGGSRAIAFHLGCLRTLHRLGILPQACVLSTVSGGSVIGAMWATHSGTFDEFEVRVREVLRTGFFRPSLRTAFTTLEAVRALLAVATLVSVWACSIPIRAFVWLMHRTAGAEGPTADATQSWMPRRFASRTTILRRTFERLLFPERTLGSVPASGPQLVVVATELRTGSAFYFTPTDAGSWRIGKLDARDLPLATAVAASAAYPLFLPALDEVWRVRTRDGAMVSARVTLTDGGVYDNLGLAPLWPERDPDISVQVDPVDTIVACRAGYGGRMGSPSLFIAARMKAAFFSVFARAQNASMKRLYDLQASGKLKSFVLPYLDQVDERLKYRPEDLVTRDAVADYPTDFSAMAPAWIEKLSKRGEQLTLAVIREHAPHLLPDDWESRTGQSATTGSGPEPGVAPNSHPGAGP